jgi:hypothetical protein
LLFLIIIKKKLTKTALAARSVNFFEIFFALCIRRMKQKCVNLYLDFHAMLNFFCQFCPENGCFQSKMVKNGPTKINMQARGAIFLGNGSVFCVVEAY